MLDNKEVARVLYEIADVLEIQEIDFKPRAYRNAARIVESLPKDINEVFKEGKLEELPSIGKAIAEKISELLKTGRLRYYEDLKKELPFDFESLMSVPGIGPKKVSVLYKKLKIRDIADLEAAARSGRVRNLEGMGEKSEQDILRNIEFTKKSGVRKSLGFVLPIAHSILEALRPFADNVELAGSLRRMKETIGDVDILATSSKPQPLIEAFTGLKDIDLIQSKGLTKCSVRMRNGLQVDIRILKKNEWGSALNYFTGSKEHNVRLRQIAISQDKKLSEYGVFDRKDNLLASKTEQDVYSAFGMDYVEAELRENTGEIEAAQKHILPKLITLPDIKGDLQMHTNYSDGMNSVEEMAKAAIELGYEYIGISDHAGSLKVANSLDGKRIGLQRKEIDSLNKKLPIRIFQGLEVNIMDDGKIDVPDNILVTLDFVIASIHSGFKNSREKMTNRICKAMENPYVNFIAHPTGRLINERQAYDLDFERVFAKAKETGKALEINAHPSRLDLNDIHSRLAVRMGLKLFINTDAHNSLSLSNMFFGVATARRAWCERKDILNTLPLKQFEKILR